MFAILSALGLLLPVESVASAFPEADEAMVLKKAGEGEAVRHHPALAAKPLPPCSTFKIWNTAIGLEVGVLKEADQPFYVWDGKKRWLEAWNRDLTLKEAFAVSSVVAYQALARDIGAERMSEWIKRLHYGDENISSGLDVFWLPSEGRTPLLISADQQVELLEALVTHKLPLSAETVAQLREVMLIEKTEKGALYGKTGTGRHSPVGWFVGFLERGGETLVFAAVTTPKIFPEGNASKMPGPAMRARVIELLKAEGLL